jgi:hypothetical protein
MFEKLGIFKNKFKFKLVSKEIEYLRRDYTDIKHPCYTKISEEEYYKINSYSNIQTLTTQIINYITEDGIKFTTGDLSSRTKNEILEVIQASYINAKRIHDADKLRESIDNKMWIWIKW